MISQLISEDNRIEIGTGTYATGTPLLRPHHPWNKIIIGNYCSLAEGVSIFAGGNHPLDFITTHPLKLFLGIAEFDSWSSDCGDAAAVTTIGNDVWIGHEACILSGANVGDGVIIGARSVVRGEIPPYAIVIGNPAQIIRFRFDEETISKLLTIKWWNWSLNKIRENVALIGSRNIQHFLNLNTSDNP